ncbi:MAG: Bifunctional ligase/repressor BirA [Candidatus Anoxychlamydiales bacterium]|nr:Bifunctional ligase/repressor BirA [Candidatus Anoxychlamydiales bacterium]
MGFDDIFLKTVDSTQEYAKKNVAKFNKSKITCISADIQTKGKGRFNREWLSPDGDNLNITFYFQLKSKCLHLVSIAHILALSLTKVLRDSNLDPKIKWPNDVMLDNKKLAGMLCEIQTKNEIADIFLGVGINVNANEEFLSKIDQKATSLKVETKKTWDKNELLKNLKEAFYNNLKLFNEKGFEPFHEKFENLLLYKGEKITFFDGQKEYKGILHSISSDGKLNLYMPDKEMLNFAAGDILCK